MDVTTFPKIHLLESQPAGGKLGPGLRSRVGKLQGNYCYCYCYRYRYCYSYCYCYCYSLSSLLSLLLFLLLVLFLLQSKGNYSTGNHDPGAMNSLEWIQWQRDFQGKVNWSNPKKQIPHSKLAISATKISLGFLGMGLFLGLGMFSWAWMWWEVQSSYSGNRKSLEF